MRKTFILVALIVLVAVVSSNASFAEDSCGGQEVTIEIARALGWQLSDELLTLGIVWLTSISAESTCLLSATLY